MMHMVPRGFFLCIITGLWFAASISASIGIKLALPKAHTVITGNTIRLLAEIPKDADPVKEVRFYIVYSPFVDSSAASHRTIDYLGKAEVPPFEYIADLRSIPDQNCGTLQFFFTVVDPAGKVVDTCGPEQRFLVLDRNLKISDKRFICRETNTPPHIDALLTDWKNADSIGFINGDNTIKAYSLWDEKYLYFGIEVIDNSIIGPYPQRGYLVDNAPDVYNFERIDSLKYVPVPNYDEVELFFDAKHDHSMTRKLDDTHFLIGAKGAYYGRRYDRKLGISNLWGKSVRCSVAVYENPSRYVIEAAFPWQEFQLKPKEGLAVGFDLLNKNYMFIGRPSIGVSWNGCEYYNYNNPSEWGDLVLAGGDILSSAWLLVCVLFIGASAVVIPVVLWRKKRMTATKEELLKKQAVITNNMEKYLMDNYANPDFTIAEAARHSGISPRYAGSLFKAEKKISFSQYLNNYRVERAKEMLRDLKLSVTEIAFAVGYNSPEHFTRVFKSIEESSPNEYRQTTNRG